MVRGTDAAAPGRLNIRAILPGSREISFFHYGGGAHRAHNVPAHNKEPRMTIERLNENAHMSKIVIHDILVYMSGQVADDPTQDFDGQLRQILAKLDAQLEGIGLDRKHILSAMVWIDDYKKWPKLNEIWDQWVIAGHKPVRSCVEAKLAFPEYEVEIAVTAARKL